jgi:hypothetical protein
MVFFEPADHETPSPTPVPTSPDPEAGRTGTDGRERHSAERPSRPYRVPEPTDVIDWTRVDAALARIRVEPEHRRGYDRDAWPHWLDLDGDCLDTRDEVLLAESAEPVVGTPDGCDVIGGLWYGRYTGEVYRNPRVLDIDHLVPLQEAHDSGGHAWSRERRAAYANDLTDPRTLIAVHRSSNRSKGADGPEEWLPPDRSYRCRYVADWIAVKARWDLSMDVSERVAVGNVVSDCRRRNLAGETLR